jgi:hypothetical protein
MQVDPMTTFVLKIGLLASALAGLWHFGIITVSKNSKGNFRNLYSFSRFS